MPPRRLKSKAKAIEITFKCDGHADITFEVDEYKIKFDQVSQLFPGVLYLTYKNANDKNVVVRRDDNHEFQLIEGIEYYSVHTENKHQTTFSKGQQLRYQQIVDDLETDTKDEYKSELKKESIPKIGHRRNKSKFTNLYLTWQHRDSSNKAFVKVNKPIGGNKIVSLNHENDYSMEHVRNKAIALFSNPLTKNFFDEKLCVVQLTSSHRDEIFSNTDEKSIWDYRNKILDTGGRWNLTLMTTKLDNSAAKKVDSEELADQDHAQKTSNKTEIKSGSTSSNSVTDKRKVETSDTFDFSARDASLKVKTAALQKHMNKMKDDLDKMQAQLRVPLATLQENKDGTEDVFKKPLMPTSTTTAFSLAKQKCQSTTDQSKSKLPNDENAKGSSLVDKKTDIKSEVSLTEFCRRHPVYVPNGYKRMKLDLKNINAFNLSEVTEIPYEDLKLDEDQELGRGGFGTVYKGYWSGTAVAVKCIETMTCDPKDIVKEVALLRQVSHKNVVLLMGVCSKPESTEYLIVTELVVGKTLKQIIKSAGVRIKYNLSIDDQNNVVKQIFTAFTFLHEHPKQLIHRDIKPENIMLTYDKVVKICDLGLAKMASMNSQLVTTQGKNSWAGTPIYMAPEVYLYKTGATVQSDVWSLGCTVVEFYNFKSPVWNITPPNDSLEKCLKNEKPPEIGNIPLFLKDSILNCFSFKACDRPSVKQLLQIFEKQEVEKK